MDGELARQKYAEAEARARGSIPRERWMWMLALAGVVEVRFVGAVTSNDTNLYRCTRIRSSFCSTCYPTSRSVSRWQVVNVPDPRFVLRESAYIIFAVTNPPRVLALLWISRQLCPHTWWRYWITLDNLQLNAIVIYGASSCSAID